MNPGDTTSPAQSIVSRPSRFLVSLPTRGPIASIFSPTISTSATSSIRCDGSITRPPRSSSDLLIVSPPATRLPPPARPFRRLGELRISARQHVEHRHSHRDAVRHLIEYHAEGSVGHVGIDLDAAIHRAWMKNENVTLGAVEPLARPA